jgi:3-hydroxyisobutyrate dehydrogenase-like beta-hydroxyacid dehydrogenase
VSHADAIITCLPNSDVVVATKERIAGSLRPGTIWIDTTSGSADRAAELARELYSDYAVHYLDCAVSGGPAGAQAIVTHRAR